MKKKVLLFILLTSLIACNDCNKCNPCTVVVTPDGTVATQTNQGRIVRVDCPSNTIDLSEYEKLGDDDVRKAEWLRNYGHTVCKKILYESVLEEHLLRNVNLDQVITPSENKINYNCDWGKLKKNIGSSFYNLYIGFEVDESKNWVKKIKFIPEHTKDEPCYSIPLFLSIAESYFELDESCIFEFTFANITASDKSVSKKLVIKVTKKSDSQVYFFDYSDEPKLFIL